ncbi:MAG: PAS domain S-box protein [Cyclobacteriaceae bacterium]|nr:PAS domain S-box protein [Cyclobacteriaceae bacterium]
MITDEPDFTDPRELRIHAEKLLKEKEEKAEKDKENEADVKKLLHELQVHQIELNMQNEELRLAYDRAEEALKKYTLLFDHAPMGYLTLESDGSIHDLNHTATELLGERRFSLINSNFKLYISEESRSTFGDFFTRIFTSHKKESCKVILGYDHNPLCLVYLEGILIENDNKCLLTMVDVSQYGNTK